MPATRVEYSQSEHTIAYFTVTDYAPSSFGFVIDKIGATSAPVADCDDDGDVDGADFLAWQLGETSNPLSSTDLAAWEATFGTVDSPIAAVFTAVPEPDSFVLLLLLTTVTCGLRRRKLT